MRRSRLVALGATVALCAVSTAAFGLPWDIDMADSTSFKGYERDMGGLPAGVVAQASPLSPDGYAPNFRRETPEGQALTSPLPDDEATRALGKQMFEVYCTPCHGADGASLGPVAQPGRVPGVVPLAGAAGVARMRTDGWIYLTIRNGSAIMPPYAWAMTDQEMWAIVHYLRTLPNAKFTPPEAP